MELLYFFVICAIGFSLGVATAFFCMFFYRRGVNDGQKMRNDEPLEPVFEKPDEEPEEGPDLEELDKEIQAMVQYKPQHVIDGETG